jgi:hypothetical protein
MGLIFMEREPHGMPLFILPVLVLLGFGSFWLARRFPRTVWLTVPLLGALVYVPIVNLIVWLLGTAEADYAIGVHVRSAIEVSAIVLALALPILGARRHRTVQSSTSRLTTR